MRVVLVADRVDRDLGLLGDYLRSVRAILRYVDRESIDSDDVDVDLLILLGSNRSAHHSQETEIVSREISLIEATLSAGIPVIGICYGAQVLARALGGSSELGTRPECGWEWVDSTNEELCPSGRWGQMHHDVFVPAHTSTVIGFSSAGPQAFIDDSRNARSLGWQFHPELTLPTLERWLVSHYSGSEYANPRAVLDSAALHSEESNPRAFALFEKAFRYLGVPMGHTDIRTAGENVGPFSAPKLIDPTVSVSTEAICVLGYN